MIFVALFTALLAGLLAGFLVCFTTGFTELSTLSVIFDILPDRVTTIIDFEGICGGKW